MKGESSNWSSYASLVRDRILHQAEGPTLDKKREHYYFDAGMTDDDGNPVDHCRKRADFLKDLIALANAARRQNEEAYLCLGIAEFDDWTIWGIEGRHPRRNPNPTWATVEAHPEQMSQWAEGIQRTYMDFAKGYIEPGLPEVHYETGWIDEQHLLGLLVIRPSLNAPSGFYLTEKARKRVQLKEMGLTPGYSWRRLGANNDPIEPQQREWMLQSYREYPYISLAGWRAYLGKLSEEVSDDPDQPDLYLPLQGHYQGERIEDVAEFLDQFVHSAAMPNGLVVIGAPGCGKTTLLERLVHNLALEASQAIESTHGQPYVPGQIRALDYPKDAPVPVLIRLWGFEYRRRDTPESRFCHAMTNEAGNILKLDQHSSPADVLKDRDLHFVVMLDGLDEISSRNNRQRTLSALAGFVADNPHTHFVITCRSDLLQDMGPEWGAYSQLYIEPMTPVQARQYLAGTVWGSLLDRDDILTGTLQLLCNPRRINALREADMLIPSLGTVLESAIEGFLTEEHKKYVHQQQVRFRLESKINRFAFQLLEQGLERIDEEQARAILSAKAFDWLYRAGLIVLRDGYCSFIEPIVRDYFAARQLLVLCRNCKLSPAVRQITMCPDQWQRAIQIAANIWREDITAQPMGSLIAQLQPKHRLQVIAERHVSRMMDLGIVETALDEYLQGIDVSLTLLVQLLQDQAPAVQRAVIQAIETAHYMPAADALYDTGKRVPQGSELQWQIVSTLTNWGDPRGEELRPETKEETEEDEPIRQTDVQVSTEPLKSNILASTGG